MKLSPRVRGIAVLNWTMTCFAARMAECIASTDVPSEQNPCASGGVALTKTASSGSRPESNSRGTSDRNVGMYSARPSAIAARALRPDEQRSMAEVRRHLGREMRAGPLAVEVDDAHVRELGRPRDKRIEEDRRRRRGALEIDLLAGRDAGDGLGGGDDAHRSRIVNGRRLCRVDLAEDFRPVPDAAERRPGTDRRRAVYGVRLRTEGSAWTTLD